jgi:hypothetical protein
MAQPFGDLVDAEPGIKQVRRNQVPDLVRAERPDTSRGSDLVEPAGDIVRPQMPACSASEQVPRRPARCRSPGQALEGVVVQHQHAEAVRRLRRLHPDTATRILDDDLAAHLQCTLVRFQIAAPQAAELTAP